VRSPAESGKSSRHCLQPLPESWEGFSILEGHTEYSLTVKITRPMKDPSTNEVRYAETLWRMHSSGPVEVFGNRWDQGDSWAELSLGTGAEDLAQPLSSSKTLFFPSSSDDSLENAVLLPPEKVDFSGMTLVTGVQQKGWLQQADMCQQTAGAWEVNQLNRILSSDQSRADEGEDPDYWIKGECLGAAHRQVVGNVSFLLCPFTKQDFFSSVSLHVTWRALNPDAADSSVESGWTFDIDTLIASNNGLDSVTMMLVVVLMLCVLLVCISVFKKTVKKKKEVSKGPEASACAPGIVGNFRKRPTMMLQQAAELQRMMMMMAILQRRLQMEAQQMEAQQNAEVQMMMMMSQQQGGPQMMSQLSGGPPMMQQPGASPVMSMQQGGWW